jgi:hypothetical protein
MSDIPPRTSRGGSGSGRSRVPPIGLNPPLEPPSEGDPIDSFGPSAFGLGIQRPVTAAGPLRTGRNSPAVDPYPVRPASTQPRVSSASDAARSHLESSAPRGTGGVAVIITIDSLAAVRLPKGWGFDSLTMRLPRIGHPERSRLPRGNLR